MNSISLHDLVKILIPNHFTWANWDNSTSLCTFAGKFYPRCHYEKAPLEYPMRSTMNFQCKVCPMAQNSDDTLVPGAL